MTNKKAPQAAEAAQGTTNQIQNTTESAKSQIDFTELEELVHNAKAYTELLYGLALAEDVDGDTTMPLIFSCGRCMTTQRS